MDFGPFSSPGRPKMKSDPLGGQRPAQRWSVGAIFHSQHWRATRIASTRLAAFAVPVPAMSKAVP